MTKSTRACLDRHGLPGDRHGTNPHAGGRVGVPSHMLTKPDLDQLTARTLAHYDRSARSFQEGTRDHDVSQNITALLDAIEGPPPFTVLDLGCGPGRDLAA